MHAKENRNDLGYVEKFHLLMIPIFWLVCGEVFIKVVMLATFFTN